MKKNKREKGHFYWLLARNYISFTLAIVISFSLITILAFLKISGVLRQLERDTPENYLDILESGNYDEFPVEDLLDDNGFIVILDKNCTPIYQSKKNVNTKYTLEDLSYIPNFDVNSYTDVSEYYDENNEKRILVTSYTYIDNEAFNQEIWIFDENLNIIYSTRNTDRTYISEKEFSYLTRNIDNTMEAMKYAFKGNTGEHYVMILQKYFISNKALMKVANTIGYTLWGFLIIYLLMIAFFIYWLNRKVKKPLLLLNDAILNFSNGNHDEAITYSGPTEFVQICDNFNTMAMRLSESETKRKQLQDEKKKMLANISHDLKTPITVIQGYSKAICDNIIKDDQKDVYLNIIYQKSEALTELINTFSEYNKLEHPNFNLALEIGDICEYAREYLAEKYDEIEVSESLLEANIPENILLCYFDSFQLKRVFENIISNFLKYNPKGTTLFFNLYAVGSMIKITIGDNGVGIPKKASQHIFNPFIVGDDSRNAKQGSGLGLAIAKKIIQEHGGKINLVTPPSEGFSSEFEILLPRSAY